MLFGHGRHDTLKPHYLIQVYFVEIEPLSNEDDNRSTKFVLATLIEAADPGDFG